MDVEAAVRQQYDTFAEDYDHVRQGVDRLLSRIGISAGASVLDVGCGTGALTFRLAEKARLRRVVGVDISSRQIEIARQRADELSLKNFEFHVGNACSLPLQAAEFDVVVSNIVLHLIPDPYSALAEMCRVLRPEGRAFLQCQKGDQVAPEMMAIFKRAWTEVLP